MNTVPNSEEENSLIDCIRSGQTHYFQQLVDRYQARIYATVVAMLGNRQDAEDVVQETFMTAYRKLHQFQQKSSFYTWLYRISFNLAIDLQRKGGKAKKVFSNHFTDDAPLTLHPSAADSPEHFAIQNERSAMVRRALQQLDTDRRNIIAMRDIEGLDYSEIAVVLDLPIGTVRSRLHRARLELRDILKAMGVGRDDEDVDPVPQSLSGEIERGAN
jgi:RNA polymerase sigma-70 factor (ECF subfamily)